MVLSVKWLAAFILNTKSICVSKPQDFQPWWQRPFKINISRENAIIINSKGRKGWENLSFQHFYCDYFKYNHFKSNIFKEIMQGHTTLIYSLKSSLFLLFFHFSPCFCPSALMLLDSPVENRAIILPHWMLMLQFLYISRLRVPNLHSTALEFRVGLLLN